MRHVTLTCKNHPCLRWTCKSIAYSPGHGYNGMRHIFYNSDVPECDCKASELIPAPEDPWSKLSEADQITALNND
jgi:hypothetical protein